MARAGLYLLLLACLTAAGCSLLLDFDAPIVDAAPADAGLDSF